MKAYLRIAFFFSILLYFPLRAQVDVNGPTPMAPITSEPVPATWAFRNDAMAKSANNPIKGGGRPEVAKNNPTQKGYRKVASNQKEGSQKRKISGKKELGKKVVSKKRRK